MQLTSFKASKKVPQHILKLMACYSVNCSLTFYNFAQADMEKRIPLVATAPSTKNVSGNQTVLQKNLSNNRQTLIRKIMDNKILTVLIILICLFCVETNQYWYFYPNLYPKFIMRINITIAFILILVVLWPTIQQRLKK